MHKTIALLLVLLLLTACSDESKLEIDERDKQIEVLNETLQSMTSELDRNQRELAELNEEIVNYDTTIDNLVKQNSELQTEIENEKEEIQKLQSEIADFELVTIDKMNFESNRLSVYAYHSGFIGMGPKFNDINTYNTMIIIGYGDMDWEHEILDLTDGNTATLAIEVSGTLYDFKLGYIDWNEDYSSYEISEEIYSVEVLKDTDVFFNSVLAEGMPFELLSWKDVNGKEFTHLIGDNSLSGMSYPHIIISELVNME